MRIVEGDITDIKTDIIVNASNGIGYMGGFLARYIKFKGVAESIQYKTKGLVEEEVKRTIFKHNYLPKYWQPRKPGEVFVTWAGNLYPSHIIHAVTMSYPGTTSTLNVIKELLPKILSKAYELNGKSIAIPLLGAGTGGLSREEVLDLYKEFFKDIHDIEIIIVVL